MIKLTSDLLAVRTKSIVKHDRIELKEIKEDNQKNNLVIKKDNVISIVNYLKRMIVK